MTNQTFVGAPIAFKEMLKKCSSEKVSIDDDEVLSLHIADILFCVLYLITAVIAVPANGLLIWVIYRTTSLQNPSNILLCCLATADFLTGAITQPASVSAVIALETGNYDMYCTATRISIAVGYFLSGVSFLTLTAVSLDRFLALHLHLRYRELVTTPRVLVVETGICVVMVGFSAIQLAIGVRMRDTLVTIIGVSGLVVNVASYLGILKTVIKQKAAIQAQEQFNFPLSRADFSRGDSTEEVVSNNVHGVFVILRKFYSSYCTCSHVLCFLWSKRQ